MIHGQSGHRRGVTCAALAAAVCVLAACSSPPPQERPRTRLRFASGTRGAAFYPLGEELAREYERVLPGLEVEVDESEGAAANIEAVQRGDADLALSHADIAYLAYVGRLEAGRERFDRLRGIAMLQLTRVQLAVRAGAGIQRIEDLRGRRLSLGRPGPGATSTVRMVLNAFGLDLKDVIIEPLRYDEAASRLAAGSLDALFVNGSAPFDAVMVATRAGARLLPIDGPGIERLRHAYPFFSRAVIPGGTYPGHPKAIHTIGVDSLLICRADLSEVLVHDLTQRLFQVLPLLSPSPLSPGLTDLEHAPATPIPLHEGAARYYRERELFR